MGMRVGIMSEDSGTCLATLKDEMRIIQPLQPHIQPQAQASVQVPTQGDFAQNTHKNRFSTSRMAGSTPVWQPKSGLQADFAPQLAQNAPGTPSGVPENQQLGFKDLLDVINPLQHIPVLSNFYRKATGDTIIPAAQFMGGMLFGGPIGAVRAMADIAIQDRTGKGFTDNMTALVTDRPNAFKTKIPEMILQTADVTGLDEIKPAAGHAYGFGVMPRTAGLMPVADETRFAALMSSLESMG